MKLSELSYREYVALEVLPAFAGSTDDKDAVCRAFGVADSFLSAVGKTEDRVKHLEDRATRAEAKFDTLQSIHVNMGEDFGSRIALTEIWEFLGATNQTEAMSRLRNLVALGWRND
jgi:hypothetical protein